MSTDDPLVPELARTVRRIVAPHLQEIERWAFLDHPWYSNVGDHAIWLGSLRCFKDLALPPPAYAADLHTFDPSRMARRIGSGLIVLSGGGNFGDLYPAHQQFRERVVAAFPRNPILQLPQTLHFSDAGAAAQARRSLSEHPRLYVMVRDPESLEFATGTLGLRADLCPDMTFCLGPLSRPARAQGGVIRLLRSDGEAVEADHPERRRATDWPGMGPLGRLRQRLRRALSSDLPPPGRSAVRALSDASCNMFSRRQLSRGLRMLAGARTVITDRLHGHILCLLLGIPNVLLDDRYGKVSRFHQTWSSSSPLVTRVASLDEAREAASGLVAREAEGAP